MWEVIGACSLSTGYLFHWYSISVGGALSAYHHRMCSIMLDKASSVAVRIAKISMRSMQILFRFAFGLLTELSHRFDLCVFTSQLTSIKIAFPRDCVSVITTYSGECRPVAQLNMPVTNSTPAANFYPSTIHGSGQSSLSTLQQQNRTPNVHFCLVLRHGLDELTTVNHCITD